MDVKITDLNSTRKPSSQEPTATTKDKSENEQGSCSSPSRTERVDMKPLIPESPSTGTQVVEENTELTSESAGEGTCTVKSPEPTMNLKPKAQKDNGTDVVSVAQDEADSKSVRGETTEVLEKSEPILQEAEVPEDSNTQQEADSNLKAEKERETASSGSKTIESDLESVHTGATGSSMVVEKDGSIFVKADKDYMKTRPLEQVAKNQEKSSKIQFSNQLAFSLD